MSNLKIDTLIRHAGYTIYGVNLGAQPSAGRNLGPNDRESGDWVGAKQTGTSLLDFAADLEGKGNGAGPAHDLLESYIRKEVPPCPHKFLHALHSNWNQDRRLLAGVVTIDTQLHRLSAAFAGFSKPVMQLPDGRVQTFDVAQFGLVGVHLLATTDTENHP